MTECSVPQDRLVNRAWVKLCMQLELAGFDVLTAEHQQNDAADAQAR